MRITFLFTRPVKGSMQTASRFIEVDGFADELVGKTLVDAEKWVKGVENRKVRVHWGRKNDPTRNLNSLRYYHERALRKLQPA